MAWVINVFHMRQIRLIFLNTTTSINYVKNEVFLFRIAMDAGYE